MRKLVLLVGLCMLGVLTFGAAAVAQEGSGGNTIECPPGSASNAAGTTCTDLETGQPVEPISATIVNPAPNTNPCPELWALNEEGVCEQVIFPPGSEPQEGITSEQWRQDQLEAAGLATATPAATAAPAATATASPAADATGGTAALPETGGISALSLVALGLLVAGGLLSARLIRR